MSFKELQKIRQSVLIGRIKFTHHSIEEMDEDELEVLDIESALLNGRIAGKQKNGLAKKIKVCGKTTTHDIITVIGRFTEADYFLIITVFRGE